MTCTEPYDIWQPLKQEWLVTRCHGMLSLPSQSGVI